MDNPTNDYEVKDLEKIAKVGRKTVVGWIAAGWLEAYDAHPQSARNYWRIPPEAWEKFKQRHLHPNAIWRRRQRGTRPRPQPR